MKTIETLLKVIIIVFIKFLIKLIIQFKNTQKGVTLIAAMKIMIGIVTNNK